MINLIPLPSTYEEKFGEFILNTQTTVYADSEFTHCKDALVNIVEKACAFTLNTVVSKKASIRFLYDCHFAREAYKIEATNEVIEVFASNFAGGFYAVQTLRQLLNADLLQGANVLTMHAISITDKPRYNYRGIMLDESRHFFGMDSVKKLLNMMAMHKLNVFHWHLTDDVGWRIEIKKYPKLTEIGALRAGSQNLAWGRPDVVDNTPYEGYYTQDEIKEIVTYAAKLNIMVVPEIDIPAHFGAALASYPWLSCTGRQIESPYMHTHGEHSSYGMIACAGKESTYQFIYDVIDELAEMFPAPYVHIGGDEAPKNEWKNCALCQKVIKDNGLANEEELQGYLNNKIALYLKTKGKRLIGWNEILKADTLDSSAIAQYWVTGRDKRVEEHIAKGGDVIISKHEAFYFDMPYAMYNLKSTYKFEPEDINLSDTNGGILGIEAPLWTEFVVSDERLQFQLFPRMEALAEVCWSPREKRNYLDFQRRLKEYIPVLKNLGITYADERVVDNHGFGAKMINASFCSKDAHKEYKQAVKRMKRKNK